MLLIINIPDEGKYNNMTVLVFRPRILTYEIYSSQIIYNVIIIRTKVLLLRA